MYKKVHHSERGYAISDCLVVQSYRIEPDVCTSLQVWRVVRLTSPPYSPLRREVPAREVSVSPSKVPPRPRCRARITAMAAVPWSTCRPSQEITRSLSSSPRKISQVWLLFNCL